MLSSTRVLLVSVLIACVTAAPVLHHKRIAQVIADSTQDWEQACIAAGGGQQCNPVSVASFSTLLAAAKACDQQDAADNMIDLAKQLNNDSEMIRLAQLFVQQPRNAPDSLQVPYCQTAPRNAELDGLFHCQFAGSKFPQFSGDQTGNIPLGLSSAVSPAGSCPAHTDGPVADGVQLNTLVSSPGSGSGTTRNGSTTKGSASTSKAATGKGKASKTAQAATPTNINKVSSGSSSSAGSFLLQNGKDAQALNAQFSSLSASSTCKSGTNACINGAFAQCVDGSFVTTQCSGGLSCFALPLVNKAGTSITCDTQADALARITATGASGGISG